MNYERLIMKILVNVKIPAINNEYDMLIPDFEKIGTIIGLLNDIAAEMSGNQYAASGEEVLCHLENNVVLENDYTLKDYDVKNGDTLLLI